MNVVEFIAIMLGSLLSKSLLQLIFVLHLSAWKDLYISRLSGAAGPGYCVMQYNAFSYETAVWFSYICFKNLSICRLKQTFENIPVLSFLTSQNTNWPDYRALLYTLSCSSWLIAGHKFLNLHNHRERKTVYLITPISGKTSKGIHAIVCSWKSRVLSFMCLSIDYVRLVKVCSLLILSAEEES